MLVVDAFRAEAFVREALERRMRGERFAVRFMLLDDATAVASAALGALLKANPPGPKRRAALDALGARTMSFSGKPQRLVTSRTPAQRAAMHEISLLASAVIVRSEFEREELATLLGTRRERIRVEPPPASDLGVARSNAEGEAILVYARGVRPDVTSLVVHALDEERRPRIVIGDARACALATATVTDDLAAALRASRIVVVADPCDPGAAIALAQAGRPLAVAETSGARDYLDDVSAYDPWDPRSIRAAVAEAGASAAPRLRNRPNADVPAEPRRTQTPLVSLVVRTRDRPRFLARALASIRAQTYPAIETVVVVDGGVPVDEILAAYPPAKRIVNAESIGPVPALIAGMNAATGTYLGLLDDDDVLFPDHIERLVHALLAADARVAQSMTAALFARPDGEHVRIFGVSTFLRRVARPDRIHLEHGAGPMSWLVRRDAYDESGGFDAAIGHAEDWDLLVRVSERDDVVFVPEVTCAYTIRPESADSLVQTGGERLIAAQRRMIEKYPLADRPRIAQARAKMLDDAVKTAGKARFPAYVPVDGGRLW
jgi:hypothetical protein